MRASSGAPENFIRSHVSHVGDECLLWPYGKNDKGYGLAAIDGKQQAASRWMCTLAHGDPPTDKHEAAHSCGNGHLGCINPNHLSWKTHAQNMADRKVHGTEIYGTRNGKTNLTEADVRAIRAAPPRLAPLMAKYGMSKHGISKIRSGKRWVMVE